MFHTYLPFIYHFIFLLLLAVFWLLGSFFFGLIIFFSYSIVLLLFRKNPSAYQVEPAFKKGVVFSPVNGSVKSIDYNIIDTKTNLKLTRITLIINPWNESGIYLPIASEIQEFFITGLRPLFRYKRFRPKKLQEKELEKLSLTLQGVDLGIIRMEFIRCVIGLLPEIIVMPGDRGKEQANIGHFPFGGTLLLYLPDNYEILVEEAGKVLAGESLLAGVKKDNEVP